MRKWSRQSSRTPLQMRSRVRPNISRVMAEEDDRPATAGHDNAGVARLQACAHPDCYVSNVSSNGKSLMWSAVTQLSDFCRGHGVLDEDREASPSDTPKICASVSSVVCPQTPCITKLKALIRKP